MVGVTGIEPVTSPMSILFMAYYGLLTDITTPI